MNDFIYNKSPSHQMDSTHVQIHFSCSTQEERQTKHNTGEGQGALLTVMAPIYLSNEQGLSCIETYE